MALLDRSFLELLEFRITRALERAEDPALRSLWCDGVLPPAVDLDEAGLAKLLHDRRQIELDAFIGRDGQDRWRLVLHLGPSSVSRIARGLDLEPCVPDESNIGWTTVRDDRVIDVELL